MRRSTPKRLKLLRDAYSMGILEISCLNLLPYEMFNVLKFSGAFREEKIKEIAGLLDDLQLSLHDLKEELASRSVEIAIGKGLTI
ncbi:MAG: hypothetical protein NZ992_08510 [Candidatus Korarchaeum sp.]|nr:hypothetical protein [Candidatus Korarchaeum sp.]MDW8035259.1 hypothetical protein [Candidatus Korarchaeum sp.]